MTTPSSKHAHPVATNRAAFRRALTAWYRKNARPLPWRQTTDPYAILVSEVMLQQTQVTTVIDYYHRWLARFPDVESLAAAPEQDVLHAWQGLGYYSRARNLQKAAQHLVHDHNGVFPTSVEALKRLPGVGRYTAAAVASFAFDRGAPLVDANVARLLSRIFNYRDPIDTSAGQRHLWNLAAEMTPRRGRTYNNALMELGALICLPSTPRCDRCPVHKFCDAEDPASLPIKKPRRRQVAATDPSLFITHNGKILLEKETGKRWHGMWRLPKTTPPPDTAPTLTLHYPITHFKVRLDVFTIEPPKSISRHQVWFDVISTNTIPMPTPHRKALTQLLQP